MVEIRIQYQGDLHCAATHGPSGRTLETDAPVDNQGRGESFSPTDLLATSYGTCMSTVIGIVARRKEIPLDGFAVTVRKHMSEDLPRRIARLEVILDLPLAPDHPERALLESTGRGCPVAHSIHPDITVDMTWNWNGAA